MTKELKNYVMGSEQLLISCASILFLNPALQEAKKSVKVSVLDLSNLRKKVDRLHSFFEAMLSSTNIDWKWLKQYIQENIKELDSYFELAKTAKENKIQISKNVLDFMLHLKTTLNSHLKRADKLQNTFIDT